MTINEPDRSCARQWQRGEEAEYGIHIESDVTYVAEMRPKSAYFKNHHRYLATRIDPHVDSRQTLCHAAFQPDTYRTR